VEEEDKQYAECDDDDNVGKILLDDLFEFPGDNGNAGEVNVADVFFKGVKEFDWYGFVPGTGGGIDVSNDAIAFRGAVHVFPDEAFENGAINGAEFDKVLLAVVLLE
jgi:hypothetical protein